MHLQLLMTAFIVPNDQFKWCKLIVEPDIQIAQWGRWNCNHNQAKYCSAGTIHDTIHVTVHDTVAASNKCILQFKHK